MGLVPIITQVLLYGTIFLTVILVVSYIASKLNGNKVTRSEVPSYNTAGYGTYGHQAKPVNTISSIPPKTPQPVKQHKIYPIELPSKEIRVYKTANFATRDTRSEESYQRELETKKKRTERVPRYTIVNGNGQSSLPGGFDDTFSYTNFRSNTHSDFFRSASNQ